MSGKIIKTIADLEPDKRNANKGTVRGRAMLDHSLRTLGAGRSVVVDKNGRIIAGNKTIEVAADIGLPIEVVRTRGDKLVVVQRDDLDLDTDAAARELAYADNRTSEVGLAWDANAIAADLEAGIDLTELFDGNEVSAILNDAADKYCAPVIDDGEYAQKHNDRVKPTGSMIVVGVGSFAGLVLGVTVDQVIARLKLRFGDDPHDAIPKFCDWILHEGIPS